MIAYRGKSKAIDKHDKKRLAAFLLVHFFLFLFILFLPDLFGASFGWIEGYVRDEAGQGIDGGLVESDIGHVAMSFDGGFYGLMHPAGTVTLTASADGYQPQTVTVFVADQTTINQDFTLQPRPLAIESVQPNWGELGQDLEVTITGAGFDPNTRVVMYPDGSNRRNILGSVDTPGLAWAVTVAGNVAYVADNNAGGLQVIDVTNPAKPSLLGSVDTSGSACGVAVAGNVAYVADGYSGLQVIDVSNPAKPSLLGSVDTPGTACGITVVGNVAYVADGYSGLQVIDVSNPAKPSLLGSVDTPDLACGVAVVGNVAYVADGYSGLQVIDVSNPAKPSLLGPVSYPGYAMGVVVAGNVAYVANSYFGLEIVDVRDPAHPSLLGSVNMPGTAKGVSIVNNLAYVAVGSGLQVIDVTNPVYPSLLGSLDTPGGASAVAVIGNVAYVAANAFGLQIVDVSNLTNFFGSVDISGDANQVAVVGNMAYVAAGASGLAVIDVSNPAKPFLLGSVNTPGTANGVTVVGNVAYVADYDAGLQIMDVSDSLNPFLIGSVDTPGHAMRVTVVSNVAYVADYDSGLQIFDVSDPAKPFFLGAVVTPTRRANGVTVVGNVAYVADYFLLTTINVRDPANPSLLGSVVMPNMAVDVAVMGNVACVAELFFGLQLVDVSDPAKPTLLGAVANATGFGTNGVTMKDNVVYVADNDHGLQVIDVSNPVHPVILCNQVTSSGGNSVAVAGQYAYIAGGTRLSILPLPIEISPVQLVGSSQIKVILPSPPMRGHYTLRVFNALQADELHGAVTLSDKVARSKAIIVAGSGPYDNYIWAEIQRNANYAYQALLWQGYKKENIKFLSAVNQDIDGNGKLDEWGSDANLVNLEIAITSWAHDADDLILYMMAHGGSGTFDLKHTDTVREILSASTLANWLNNLQRVIPGRVIFVNEACYSGSFLEPLQVPEGADFERIAVTSSASCQNSILQQGGRLSFSYQFWAAVIEGGNVAEAFNFGKKMMAKLQTAQMDTNGDGLGNLSERDVSNVCIGRCYKSAAAMPTIGNVLASHTLTGAISLTIWAEGIRSLNPISKVWAVIVPPTYDPSAPYRPEENLPTVELTDPDGDGRYEGAYNGFATFGAYEIAYYLMDDRENISLPETGTVTQTVAPDLYEEDDSPGQATSIVLNDSLAQEHAFHTATDTDWIKFYGVAGESYVVEANILFNDQHQTDMVIELYDTDGSTMLQQEDQIGAPYADESLDWVCEEDGLYYLRFRNKLGSSGLSTRYAVTMKRPIAPEQGTLFGYIKDATTSAPIVGAAINTDLGASDLSREYGQYTLREMAGRRKLTVMASGYNPWCEEEVVVFFEGGTFNLDFYLNPNDPAAFAGKFGKTYAEIPLDSDFDCDGDVDGIDLAMLAKSMQ